MECSSCGEDIVETDYECPHCGVELDEEYLVDF